MYCPESRTQTYMAERKEQYAWYEQKDQEGQKIKQKNDNFESSEKYPMMSGVDTPRRGAMYFPESKTRNYMVDRKVKAWDFESADRYPTIRGLDSPYRGAMYFPLQTRYFDVVSREVSFGTRFPEHLQHLELLGT